LNSNGGTSFFFLVLLPPTSHRNMSSTRSRKRRRHAVKKGMWERILEHAERFETLFEELGHAREDGLTRKTVEDVRNGILQCLDRARADVFTHTRPYTWTPNDADRGCLTLRVLSEVVNAAPNLLFNPRANVRWCRWDKYLNETSSAADALFHFLWRGAKKKDYTEFQLLADYFISTRQYHRMVEAARPLLDAVRGKHVRRAKRVDSVLEIMGMASDASLRLIEVVEGGTGAPYIKNLHDLILDYDTSESAFAAMRRVHGLHTFQELIVYP